MSGVSSVSSSLMQQMYQKLFDRLNADGDDAVNLDELAAGGAGSADTAKVFKTLDADSDGRIVRAEMTPSDAFGAETLGALIDAQTGPAAPSDPEFLARWFAQADTDGDNLLSKSEQQADADLRRAASYDAGYMSTRMAVFIGKPGDDGPLTLDQMQAVQVKSLNIDPSKLRLVENAPSVALERLNAARARAGLDPVTLPPTPESHQRRLEQLKADIAERNSGPEGTRRFLGRDLEGLRTGEAARIAAAPLSDALIARLFNQMMQGWTTQPAQTVDTTA